MSARWPRRNAEQVRRRRRRSHTGPIGNPYLPRIDEVPLDPMTVTLYQAPPCPFARRSRIVLEHLGVPYENRQVELGNTPAGFESVSPYGLVPALVHDGHNVYESNIINEYLDETFEGGLMPTTPEGRARVRIVMSWIDDQWMGPQYQLKMYRLGMQEGTEAEVEAVRQKVLDRLRTIDDTMTRGPGPWLVDGALTLADIALATTLPYLPEWGVEIPSELKRVHAWVDAVRDLPAWKAVPVDYEDAVETVRAL